MLPMRAEGHFDAILMASLMSRASIKKKPPICSLVSAKGPSVAEEYRIFVCEFFAYVQEDLPFTG